MTLAPARAVRDPRTEDPTNLWLIDPLARALVPIAVRMGISANSISVMGLLIGAAGAAADERWRRPGWAAMGFLVSIAWLLTDSLDGMVARATGTSSAFGRELDGLCDHGVFALLYIALARSVGGPAIWALVMVAALAHAVQASLYEAERDRFQRRLGRAAPAAAGDRSRNPAIRLYERVASFFDPAAAPLDRLLASSRAIGGRRADYGRAAAPVFRAMLPLSQNMRVVAIFVACLYGRVATFLWFELVPLSGLTIIGILWHRHVERKMICRWT